MAAGMDHLAGRDPRAEFGPDGLERATAEVGAVLNVPASKAREIVTAGDTARYRLVFTGQAWPSVVSIWPGSCSSAPARNS